MATSIRAARNDATSNHEAANEVTNDEAPHDEAPHDEAPHDEAPHDEAPHDEVPNDPLDRPDHQTAERNVKSLDRRLDHPLLPQGRVARMRASWTSFGTRAQDGVESNVAQEPGEGSA